MNGETTRAGGATHGLVGPTERAEARAAVPRECVPVPHHARRRWTGYLWLVVLIGLVGGISMAAIAGARRTQSSFPTYEASTNPSDLEAFTAFQSGTGTGYSARVDSEVAHLPYVGARRRWSASTGRSNCSGPLSGHSTPGEAFPAIEGSPDDEYLTTDRVTVLQGRLWIRRAPRVHAVGRRGPVGGPALGSSIRALRSSATHRCRPRATRGTQPTSRTSLISLKLVGIVENDAQVVQSDDQALGDQFGVLSPRSLGDSRVLRLLHVRGAPSRGRSAP